MVARQRVAKPIVDWIQDRVGDKSAILFLQLLDARIERFNLLRCVRDDDRHRIALLGDPQRVAF